MGNRTFTYQTRITTLPEQDKVLDEYASLYNKINLKGKIASIRELQKVNIQSAETRIGKIQKIIKKLNQKLYKAK